LTEIGARRPRTCFDDQVRVLFSTTAGAGHFGPMVPVAHACRAAGHAVAVAAPASFGTSVTEAGLEHLPFPDVPAEVMGAVFARLPSLPREEANRIVIGEVFGRLDAQAALPTMIDTIRDWTPDVVVRDPAEVGALVAAAKFAVPQVQVAIDMGGFIPAAADWLDEPIRELERMAGIGDLRGAERALATSTLSSVPATLDQPSAGGDPHGGIKGEVWRFRTDIAVSGPSLPAEWGDPAMPLVYVSFGSVAASTGRFDALYPAVLEALADQPVRVLITTGKGYNSAGLGPLPDNAWAEQWWPQAAAMRDAALVIGHGGFGTTMTALAAGMPQLVLPLFSSDQFLNAERVQEVGVGRRLLGGVDALPEVPQIVGELLDQPRYAEAARSIAAEMAALPDVATTVAVLEDLARRRPEPVDGNAP
jgi:UDP:flavonoid glycosyltransferase YjiC (YdhE family)